MQRLNKFQWWNKQPLPKVSYCQFLRNLYHGYTPDEALKPRKGVILKAMRQTAFRIDRKTFHNKRKVFRTLGKTFTSLYQVAQDPNCPYSYYHLKKKYEEFGGKFNYIWYDSFKQLKWEKIRVDVGVFIRLSPKHQKLWEEGVFFTKCAWWYKNMVTKWLNNRHTTSEVFQ